MSGHVFRFCPLCETRAIVLPDQSSPHECKPTAGTSPTPWRFDASIGALSDAAGDGIGALYPFRREANARLILAGVNPAPPKMFPLQDGPAIPWAFIADHAAAVKRQHCGQTLERLAERGGLSVAEVLSIVEGGGDFDVYFRGGIPPKAALLKRLLALLKAEPIAALADLRAKIAAVADAMAADREAYSASALATWADRVRGLLS